MARRTFHSGGDSLELLLDTITNAFGGVLFLALLVVMLVRSSAAHRDSEDLVEHDIAQLADELSTLNSRLASIEQEYAALLLEEGAARRGREGESLAELRKAITARQSASTALADQLQSLARLEADLRQETAAAADARDRLAARRASLAELDSNLGEARSEAAALQEQVDQERDRKRSKSPYPELRGTTKDPIAFTCRYGRLYRNRLPSGAINVEDFAVLGTEGEYLAVTPKPNRGLPIDVEGDVSLRVVETLSKLNSRFQYLQLSVWDDSFAEFALIRDYAVAHDLEYRIVFAKNGDEVIETHVANPEVQ